jgi:four helix bundle protein
MQDLRYKNNKQKITEFTDLIAWQEGHRLVLLIYQMTKSFPLQERFSLSDQIQRAVVSVTSNIAEGFGRQTIKEKVQFYYLAQGSLTEVKNQLIVARDIHYISPSVFETIYNQASLTHKLLQGLITKSKSFAHS